VIFKLLVEGGAYPNVLCMHIKNLRDHEEQPQYVVYFSTPLKIFSSSGFLPDAGLVDKIKSRGGVEFLESAQLESTEWDDAEAEAMKLKPGIFQRFQTILRLQKSKKRPNRGNKNRRSRRKGQHRANWQHA
jgi:hypothetical protein